MRAVPRNRPGQRRAGEPAGDSLRADTIAWAPPLLGRARMTSDGKQVWFDPWSVVAVGKRYFYLGNGATYEIGQYNLDGRLVRRIRRGGDREPLSRADMRLNRDMIGYEPGDSGELIASHHPYYYDLQVGDRDRLWVLQHQPAMDNSQLWAVFDTTGVWLEDVEMPFPTMMHRIAGIDSLSVMVVLPNTLSPSSGNHHGMLGHHASMAPRDPFVDHNTRISLILIP